MSDIFSTLANNYISVGGTVPSKSKYVAVDPAKYEGTWTGKYGDNKKFSITISNVDGFRAKVRYQSDGAPQYSQVLIKDSAFRIGDSKFVLTGDKKALVATVSTDPYTGQSAVKKAYATQST